MSRELPLTPNAAQPNPSVQLGDRVHLKPGFVGFQYIVSLFSQNAGQGQQTFGFYVIFQGFCKADQRARQGCWRP